ncbi:low molecular weight protein arginine phosphatase [Oceanobacillus sp. 143]|uniref:Protein tyrosine phosphatase n=1 Tax=Oceanobacillus zhaokaii TaxID=2052660 RepID=A0A345PKV7_9BACI|nr:low molecular weight protein arginine phosphatase [Oceanobacillus zhaokaii]AXI10637.1 protein tyrosine phosphatase [Oceanobacillus zhaokaii]QGS69613.1 low molecular weight protein arginine phosphatase [Oceanobacillus sp. 143]
MKILFICTGNTCRSPMAEAILKDRMPEAEVQSAGIFAGGNQQANPNTIEVLARNGIKMDHLSQPVTDRLLDWADVVLTMTTRHKQSLIIDFPEFQEKYYTLKEFISEADKRVWQELKKSYADLEEKRSLFIQENQLKHNYIHLDELLEEHLREDIGHIRRLESTLINYDIPDPFGGNLAIYEETFKELDAYIGLLIKKIDR